MTGKMAPNRSLLFNVFMRMGATMLAAVIAVSALLYHEFQDHIDTMRDRSLVGQVQDIARHLVRLDDGGVVVDLPEGLAAAYGSGLNDPPRYIVLNRNDEVLAASPLIIEPFRVEIPWASSSREFFALRDPVTGKPIYGTSYVPPEYNGELMIQASQSAEHYDVLADTLLDELTDEYLPILLLIFGLLLAVTYLSLKSALHPLQAASEQAASIGPSTLNQRLDTIDLPNEIVPLVDAVNKALARVEDGYRVQRRFTADAAHEMRTPIAVLRAHLDSLGTAHAKELKHDLDNLERVVSQLLKLAQVESLNIDPNQQTDLSQVARFVAEYLGPRAILMDKSIALEEASDAKVIGDPDAIEVAVRNLVENALRATPAGEEVVIAVQSTPPGVAVMDRGPGIDENDKPHLFSRFWRKERSSSTGAGLGLSIVSRIARAHNADISVEDRPGGGSVFSIYFKSLPQKN